MNSTTLAKIRQMAGSPTGEKTAQDPLSRGLIQDLLKGAAQNPRLQAIELGGALAQSGFSHLDIAKTAGVLFACHEAGLTVKEACEAIGLQEDALQAIAVVAL